jgi:hypothetical protein
MCKGNMPKEHSEAVADEAKRIEALAMYDGSSGNWIQSSLSGFIVH